MRTHLWGTTATAAVAIAVAVPPVVSSSPPGTSPGTPVAFGTAAPADRCDQPGPYELPHTDDTVHLDPADFTTEIDNPYWPMRVGTTWVYGETEPDGTRKRVEIVVTDRTRTIGGIEARVVHDVVTEGGEIIENTFDWYAQDAGGNLWYLGEFTREYENGVPVNTEGSGSTAWTAPRPVSRSQPSRGPAARTARSTTRAGPRTRAGSSPPATTSRCAVRATATS